MLLHLLLVLAICQYWLAFVDVWDRFRYFIILPIIVGNLLFFQN